MTPPLVPDATARLAPPAPDVVKISAASMRQRFHGCTPDYIARRCHGSCCRSSSAPGGTLVTVHRSEAEAVAASGVQVVDGRIQPVNRRCPNQTEADLCRVHGTDAKPFGCYASPFTLTSNGATLVIRNRYRMLRCYKDPLSAAWGDAGEAEAPEAYHAFAGSLRAVLGDEAAQYVTGWLDAGGGDVVVPLPPGVRAMLLDNDAAKKVRP